MVVPLIIGFLVRKAVVYAVKKGAQYAAKKAAQRALKRQMKNAAKKARERLKKRATDRKKKCTNCDKKPGLRKKYEADVKKLKELEDKLRANGKSPEEIARELHKARRDLGIKYKDLTPDKVLEKISQRNLDKYGDKLGPSIDHLRSKGKTWEQIIESATRPGGKDLGF